jgi:hypothetical protein
VSDYSQKKNNTSIGFKIIKVLLIFFLRIFGEQFNNFEYMLLGIHDVKLKFSYLMFKVSHQFIFRISLFGESDEKRKNQLSCLFTFY